MHEVNQRDPITHDTAGGDQRVYIARAFENGDSLDCRAHLDGPEAQIH
ncbi:hypothetical protein MPEAHAMD_6516 [Methylobacterium frigidaeris]|uniref:Uncharacterized protein n=1 Tax=Methylobacterium frigidaeris TaxID=2038277 RepID=A0AA37HIR0_9HYPH|nr:hypothetical protein MPEAHAMD_6516 [Methylobacterium frigidaeris]